MDSSYVQVNNLKKYFPIKAGIRSKVVAHIKAVDGVSFGIQQGKTFGLVGESGCGKSTIGRMLVGLLEPTEGQVLIGEKDILKETKRDRKSIRRKVQIIFQDPANSLDSYHTVEEIIAEPIRIHRLAPKHEIRSKVEALMEMVGLDPPLMRSLPTVLSNGQQQKVAIARALAVEPEGIVADEAVSGLDVSAQSQILNLMAELQQKLGLTYLFISHSLNVVKHISDHIGVMYLGKLVEIGSVEAISGNPLHPYSRALFSATPSLKPTEAAKRIVLEGEVPSPINPPRGCRFSGRCFANPTRECSEVEPQFRELAPNHWVACHQVA